MKFLVISQVGACIVLKEPRRAISVGYNGLPNGRDRYSIRNDDKPENYGMTVFLIILCYSHTHAHHIYTRAHAHIQSAVLSLTQ